jgi:hypothetical protein
MSTSLQYFDFPADRDLEAIAERELWTSVVLQAIDDLTGTTGPNPLAIQNAAQRWFESTSEEPRSFLWVCIHLNLDPAAVLEKILHDNQIGKSLSQASNDTLPLHAQGCF